MIVRRTETLLLIQDIASDQAVSLRQDQREMWRTVYYLAKRQLAAAAIK